MPWSSSSSDFHNPLFSSHSSSCSRCPKAVHLPTVISQHKHFLILLTLLVLLISSAANAAILLARHHSHSQPEQHHAHRQQYPYPYPYLNHSQQYCNLFVGSWIRDEAYAPTYTASDCPTIDPQFDCQLYGRPDSDYLKYRWAPARCGLLPRFDGVEFLERVRGKTVMFVGDSLGRNQWESLICMISSSAGMTRTGSPTQVFRGDPLSSFRFLEYDVTISFYKAPYLVDIDVVQGRRVLRLGDISGNGNSWRGVDILSFNTGHWWTHKGSLQGWDFMELEGRMYQDMDRLAAMEYGLRTWAHWIESNVDPSKTAVFFQSVSPSHDNPAEWSSGPAETGSSAAGKNCYGETEPMIGASFPATGGYPAACAGQMRVLTTVLSEMTHPPYLLDITSLSAMRKDGHPSIYGGELSPAQRANPARSSDCSHWCLPGLPDTWNQLFYTALFF